MRPKRTKALPVVGLLLAMAGTICSGQVIYVDAANGNDGNNGFSVQTAFASIQKGIDMAKDGDTVIVYPGLYIEIINFLGKNITLKSTNPTDSQTVTSTAIAGGIRFRGTEDPNCALTGFDIDGYIVGFDWQTDPNGENHTRAAISHCVLENNTANCGGVMQGCDGTISNCVIANMYPLCLVPWPVPQISGCHGSIKNCTIVDIPDGIEILKGGRCTIENCIIYRQSPITVASGAILNISHCNLEGGLDRIHGDGTVNWGPGNIDTDPCFVRVGSPAVDGDYHLKSQAGRWDPNTQVLVQDEVTSPCIDAGDMSGPIGFEPFPNGGIINMGAYGGTIEASRSYFGESVCETIVAGDIDGNCKVDFEDLAIMGVHWLEDNNR